MKSWRVMAAVSGFLWLLFGAMAGHDVLHDKQLEFFMKAHEYQIVHSMMIFIISAYAYKGLNAVCWLWTAGMVLFSGSLYLMSITHWPLNYVVPFGGVAFLLGWLWLAVVLWRARKASTH